MRDPTKMETSLHQSNRTKDEHVSICTNGLPHLCPMLMCEFINCSNFDKHHYKNFHRTHRTEPTLLALDDLEVFSSNSSKIPVIIENAVGYNFYANHRINPK